MARWYHKGHDDLFIEAGSTPQEAMALGMRHAPPGDRFEIALCEPKGPWMSLFDSPAELLDYVDGLNEENAFEDGFCDEAGITEADVGLLVAKINGLWSDFVEQHKPTSCGLHILERRTIQRAPPAEAGLMEFEQRPRGVDCRYCARPGEECMDKSKCPHYEPAAAEWIDEHMPWKPPKTL